MIFIVLGFNEIWWICPKLFCSDSASLHRHFSDRCKDQHLEYTIKFHQGSFRRYNRWSFLDLRKTQTGFNFGNAPTSIKRNSWNVLCSYLASIPAMKWAAVTAVISAPRKWIKCNFLLVSHRIQWRESFLIESNVAKLNLAPCFETNNLWWRAKLSHWQYQIFGQNISFWWNMCWDRIGC